MKGPELTQDAGAQGALGKVAESPPRLYVGPFSHLITPGTQRKGLYHPHFLDVKTKAHKTLPTVTKLVGVRAGPRARVPCTLRFMLPLLYQAEPASSS